MPPLSDKQLEERLSAAGKSIANPPTSLDELLPLLDRVEELLSKVEQSPPKSMQNVLNPLMKGLVSEVLLKHSDIDVKVGVASCISEITRITAPDAPYDDDKMKDVFQLIVSSFEDLSEVSSRSHEKRATILETVAKVRSCVIMLDLECDQMIIDMFQHFLKAIRANHPESIIGSMETIMTLVIEESEDISTDLLGPLLATLRKNNEDATPIARTLAERVIRSSSDKLRPYLKQALTFFKTSLDDYSDVLASVCRENTDTVVRSTESILKDKPAAEDDGDGTNCQDIDATAIRSPKSVVSNGLNETGTNEITTEANTSKRTDSAEHLDGNSTAKAESDDCDAQKPVKVEAKVDQAQQENENHDTPNKDEHITPAEVKPVKADETLDREDDKSVEVVNETSKPAEALTEASPAQSGSHPDESLSKTEIKGSSEEKLVDAEMLSVDNAPKETSVDESISETKKQRRSGKTRIDDSAYKDKALIEEVASKNDDVCPSDSEARSPEQTEKPKDASNKTEHGSFVRKEDRKKRGRKKATSEKIAPQPDKDKTLTEEVASKNDDVCASDSEARSPDQAPKDASNKTEHGSSVRKEDGKKRGRKKASSEKYTPQSSREDLGKDSVTPRKSQLKSTKHEGVQEETAKSSTKRKQIIGKEKASETPELGKNLVGSKIKVWWPKDQMFYEGVIDSFDSVKKKHKVLYNDGDKEVLNLKKEKWHFLDDDAVSNGEQDVEHSSHDTSSDLQRKRKGNMSSETTSKRQKVEESPKSKQKDSATKVGGKSKDDGKADSESKPSKKSVDDKSKDQSQKLGSKVDSAKASGRSKDDDGKNSSHSKQDNLRTPKSKVKTPTAGISVGSGGAKSKSSSSKVKERTPDAGRSSETGKGKAAADTAKSRESETKGGKKRRR